MLAGHADGHVPDGLQGGLSSAKSFPSAFSFFCSIYRDLLWDLPVCALLFGCQQDCFKSWSWVKNCIWCYKNRSFSMKFVKTHTLSYKAEENTTSTAPFKPSSLDSKCNIWKKLIRWQLFSIKMQIYTAVSVETPSIIVMINTHCANVTDSQCRK